MAKPKLLVINPNTAIEITERLRLLAVEELGDAAEIVAVTAPFGARYIATRVSALLAGHAAVDACAAALITGVRPDAVVVACFGDPGLEALQETLPIPVLGFAETGMRAAAETWPRFAIATVGSPWQDMLVELAGRLGLLRRLAGFVLLDDAMHDAAGMAQLITERTRAMEAAGVVLGGTGLIPAMAELHGRLGVPMLDPHRVTLRRALQLAQAGATAPATAPALSGTYSGLSPMLTRLLESSVAVPVSGP